MKKKFEKPTVDVIQFGEKDIIATSPGYINQAGGGSTEQPGGDCALYED